MRYLVFIMLIAGLPLISNAMLIDNHNGTITQIKSDGSQLMWLQDANMSNVAMTWYEAFEWTENLSYAGFDDWRLPTITNICTGYNCTDSEMGYLYYTELNNSAYPASGWQLTNFDPFINVQYESVFPAYGRYWFDYNVSKGAMMFRLSGGSQGWNNKELVQAHAWAVRDIPVPEPSTFLLIGIGLTGLVICNKRKLV